MELASSLDANRLITGAGCCGRLLTVSSSVKSITIDVVGAVCSLQGWRQLVRRVRHPLLPYNHYHC
jgi:hypothetical protein